MKKFRFIGIIALTAMMLFVFAACSSPTGGDTGGGGGGGGGGSGGDWPSSFTVTIDLANLFIGDKGGQQVPAGKYEIDTTSGNHIRVPPTNAGENDTVFIKGSNTTAYSIEIDAAKKIYIADGTSIKGTGSDNGFGFPALYVANGAVITGGDGNIIISGGDGQIYDGGIGIASDSDLTITGTFGAITGGSSDGRGGDGINTSGTLTISGTTGAISGGSGYSGSYGISARGDVVISGITGAITAGTGSGNNYGFDGITTNSNVTISGITGDISGGDGISEGGCGINVVGSVIISRTTGAISGGDGVDKGGYGIWTGDNVNITNTAKVASISGGNNNSAANRAGDGINAADGTATVTVATNTVTGGIKGGTNSYPAPNGGNGYAVWASGWGTGQIWP
ncbi:MAG: hypothetical protein FWC45_02150 [Treponema sp.]|nr:hypothetical protein [Treponema sp.]